MKIGVIGAGNIGATLARKFVAAGHTVKLAGSKGPEAVRDKAAEVGAVPVVAKDAVTDVAVIILSIPFAKSAADKARAPVNRDALIKGFMEAKAPLSHDQIVARNREVTAAQG